MSYEFNKQVASDAQLKKVFNVNAFSSLSREGLEFGKIERLLLLYELDNEKIYIRYPGKETKNTSDERKVRPWDFRPKVQFADGSFAPDLNFKDIWNTLYELNDINIDMSKIASMFFSIAYLVDYKKIKKTCKYFDIDVETNTVIDNGEIEFEYYGINFDSDLLIDNIKMGITPSEMSLKAFLLYNELLAQNEDCKYHYRDVIIEGKEWKGDVGRKNTLLTHMSVIRFMQGKMHFTDIIDGFQRGRGVCALPIAKIEEVTNGLIKKEQKKK